VKSAGFLLAVAAMIAVAWAFGQPAALVGFVALYLGLAARYRIGWTLLYATGAALALYVVYERVLHVRWLEPALSFWD